MFRLSIKHTVYHVLEIFNKHKLSGLFKLWYQFYRFLTGFLVIVQYFENNEIFISIISKIIIISYVQLHFI